MCLPLELIFTSRMKPTAIPNHSLQSSPTRTAACCSSRSVAGARASARRNFASRSILRWIAAIFTGSLLWLIPSRCAALNIVLTWDASTTTNVLYQVHQATASDSFDPVGPKTAKLTATISNVNESLPTRWYVTAVSTSGTNSLPSNVVSYDPPPKPLPGLSFEAEAGALTVPFYVNGTVIQQDTQTSASDGGRAAYSFAVTNAGFYSVSALVNAPTESNNSFFVNVDAEPTDANIWDVPITSGMQERAVLWRDETNTHSFQLNAGTHLLIFRGRESGVQLDKLSVVPVSVTPPPARPEPPTNLRLQQLPGNRVDVGWTGDRLYATEVWRSLEVDPFQRLAIVAAGTMHYTDRARGGKVVRYQMRSCSTNAGCSEYSAIIGYNNR